MIIENVSQELRERNQWVAWRLELREGEEKPTKVPYSSLSTRCASGWNEGHAGVEGEGRPRPAGRYAKPNRKLGGSRPR